ncbi:MAG TPA: tRNA-uridine aminocarboxypropyltransferase [Polyangiaceae bacterium]|nr:tRNA-uridine aminocarboxypropyltransferase [Polyangiaceae bacterium]
MRDRETPGLRCARCRLHLGLCVCALLPRLETRTRLVLVMHRLEARKSTNTGRLAALCLANSEIVLRGDGARPPEPFAFDPATRPLFLFPHPGARPLSREAAGGRPVTLVVPDGTWRQASKVRKRVPGLDALPCVALPNEGPSGYRLRRWPHEEGLSTLEAVARAMGELEGEPVRRALERVLRVAVERTLWARGRLDAGEVTGGIPEAARRRPDG